MAIIVGIVKIYPIGDESTQGQAEKTLPLAPSFKGERTLKLVP
jgi:hypothetical protein